MPKRTPEAIRWAAEQLIDALVTADRNCQDVCTRDYPAMNEVRIAAYNRLVDFILREEGK